MKQATHKIFHKLFGNTKLITYLCTMNKIAIFRSRDLESKLVNSHKEVIPLGYVDSLQEFDDFVKKHHPNSVRIESASHRGTGEYYFTDGDYNVFYHTIGHMNDIPMYKFK